MIGDLVVEDWGFEYRGFAFGGESDFLIAPGVTGLADNPEVLATDQRRMRRHGLHPGDDFHAGREIVIPIEVTATTAPQWALNLDRLKQAFSTRPDDGEEPLVFQVPGVALGAKRRINVRPRGLAVPIDLDWYYQIVVVVVRLVATSPDILANTATIVTSPILTGGSTGAPWPFTWPLTWGAVFTTSFFTTSGGTRDADWIATIPGPVTNPRLTHVTSGRKLELAIDVPDGATITLDSASRTVTLDGANRYHTLTPGSTWFAIQPGPNELSYQALAGDSNLQLEYRDTWA